MSAVQFTPGPWVWCGDNEIEQAEHPFRSVAEVVPIPRTRGETDANARLIAAAPELLGGCNALLGLIQLIRGRPDLPTDLRLAIEDDNYRIAEAKSAVAKAGGDQ